MKLSDIISNNDIIYIIKKVINMILNNYFQSSNFNSYISTILNQLHDIYNNNNNFNC